MKRVPLLFLNVLVISTCGLVYELLAGTLASYTLGDSVTQFSFIIGIYLSASASAPGCRASWRNAWLAVSSRWSWAWLFSEGLPRRSCS